jgi:hypothetical protein
MPVKTCDLRVPNLTLIKVIALDSFYVSRLIVSFTSAVIRLKIVTFAQLSDSVSSACSRLRFSLLSVFLS